MCSLLQCRDISVHFGGAPALEGVDFALEPGEVHGLVGSNGAGKSTLMKLLSGAVPHYRGLVEIDGKAVRLHSPQESLARGIAMVYQELSGVGQLSVAENLFLGRQPTRLGLVDWRRMRSVAREQLRELQIDVDVDRRLDKYPLVARQMVEIARGLHSGARILILDEPTSALSPPEAQRLFQLIARLKERGVAIVFISHFIEDVLEICDRVTVLKDGRRVTTRPAREVDKHQVIHAMLGRDVETLATGYEAGRLLPAPSSEPPRLVAEKLSSEGQFDGVTLSVAPGECLGLYGFVGAGHQELTHALFGALPLDGGRVMLDGRPLVAGRPDLAVKRGAALVAADRGQTIVRRAAVGKNVTLAHLRDLLGECIFGRRERAIASSLLDQVRCKAQGPSQLAGSLSGGNQQKVVMARWLAGPVRLLLLDEPTRGMDVGAKAEIMRLVEDVKRQGAAVILASVEPEMVIEHADRILVMRRGQVAKEFAGVRVDKADLMRSAV